jgi:hypothetical protein
MDMSGTFRLFFDTSVFGGFYDRAFAGETRHLTVQQKLHYFQEGALNSEFGWLLKQENLAGEKNSGKRKAL